MNKKEHGLGSVDLVVAGAHWLEFHVAWVQATSTRLIKMDKVLVEIDTEQFQ